MGFKVIPSMENYKIIRRWHNKQTIRQIAKALKTRVYFAHPYQAWQRGLNENTKGLIRQYFPKNYDFTHISIPRKSNLTIFGSKFCNHENFCR